MSVSLTLRQTHILMTCTCNCSMHIQYLHVLAQARPTMFCIRLVMPVVKDRWYGLTVLVSIRLHGKKVVISTVILEMQVASFPDPCATFGCTKACCVNCRCSAVTVPIRSGSYATWSARETVVSIQPPLSSTFFCLADVLSHMIL